jgi:hypothetical protein
MEPLAFADNSAILFGREPDLAYLAARAQHRGITAIIGRPKMGKSWLLTELSRRLSSSNSVPSPVQSLSLVTPPQYLVGFFEQEGSSADHMLRAVADLYTRWLADSTYHEQAKIFYEQHKSDLVEKSGEAVGSILKEIGGLTGKPLEKLGGIIKSAFDALASANRDLMSGGLQLPRLQTEQARDLLTWLHKITGRHIVLVLDQWEKSTNIDLEINLLDAFHRHLDKWPPCHIFLGVRSGKEIRDKLQQMHGGFSYERPIIGEPMGIYDISPMDLNESEKIVLPAYLRGRMEEAAALSGAKPPEVTDDKLLEMIGGFPYVIDQWTRPYILPKLNSVDRLQEQADNANDQRYSEFEEILKQLNDSERTLAIRLALVPSCTNPDDWKALRPIILEGLNSGILDRLKDLYVLETAFPPSYGHAAQVEAARRWFAQKREGSWNDTCEQLIFSLAARVTNATPGILPYASALVGILPAGSSISLSRLAQALLESGKSLFGSVYPGSNELIGIVPEIGGDHSTVLPLFAMGLVNTLNDAKGEQDPAWRDALLEELRMLAGRFPDNAAMIECLAKGLFNILIYAKGEHDLTRRDALLEELRMLADRYPQDIAVRKQFAKSLFNTLNEAKDEHDLAQRDALLEELRLLAGRYPQDAAVRENLAMALYNTHIDAKDEQDLARWDALLEELRLLASRNPQDAAVRESQAMALLNTFNDAMEKRNWVYRNALLEELRALASAYPDDETVSRALEYARSLLE